VAEVASVGGFVKQYQVILDPNKLLAFNIPLQKVRMAIQRSNNDVGGRLVEMGETEFMVRGLGYIKSVADIKNIPLGVDNKGTPILNNGVAEAVGGIIIMRYGENALAVIENVKKRLEQLKAGLPEGVRIVPVYDRSGLILRAVDNLKNTLLEESVIVTVVCIIFLFHLRSAFVAIFTLPVGIFISFIIMERQEPHWDLILDASREVGPALFFSLLIIAISFLPVFTLEAQEGRLFKPLAFTKTYALWAI
jgi:Cu(I)/Ag(I) efflux system membrane protein CusA/SilA